MAQRGDSGPQPEQQQQDLTPADNDQSLAMLEGMMAGSTFKKGRK